MDKRRSETRPSPKSGSSITSADRWGERHAPARGRARFSRANRVERREFFEVPYMSHRERTAWLSAQSYPNRSRAACPLLVPVIYIFSGTKIYAQGR